MCPRLGTPPRRSAGGSAGGQRHVTERWLDRVRGADVGGASYAHPFHWAGFQISESSRTP
ncbi:MAG TPA: hypothetical protein VLB75_05915 [Steroidobacteraceae bacterium]|nr:hypothetical protein [Steroidobacteraceae bacterium]